MLVAGIISGSGTMNLSVDGRPITIAPDHPHYKAIREVFNEIQAAFKNGQKTCDRRLGERLIMLSDVGKALVSAVASAQPAGGKIAEVRDRVVYYDGQPLHSIITDRILGLLTAGFDATPMLRFLERLMRNPSARARREAFAWLEHKAMPITPEGMMLGYKQVRPDFKDWYSGKVDNSVGQSPSMLRSEVDDDWGTVCSQGFHVGALSYVRGFHNASGHLMSVMFCPSDIVTVPDNEVNKLRVCRYTVVTELPSNDANDLLAAMDISPVYSGESGVLAPVTAPAYTPANPCGDMILSSDDEDDDAEMEEVEEEDDDDDDEIPDETEMTGPAPRLVHTPRMNGVRAAVIATVAGSTPADWCLVGEGWMLDRAYRVGVTTEPLPYGTVVASGKQSDYDLATRYTPEITDRDGDVYKVYTDHHIVELAKGGRIAVGCQLHPYEFWKENAEAIAEQHYISVTSRNAIATAVEAIASQFAPNVPDLVLRCVPGSKPEDWKQHPGGGWAHKRAELGENVQIGKDKVVTARRGDDWGLVDVRHPAGATYVISAIYGSHHRGRVYKDNFGFRIQFGCQDHTAEYWKENIRSVASQAYRYGAAVDEYATYVDVLTDPANIVAS
jgi:hypothetical protein